MMLIVGLGVLVIAWLIVSNVLLRRQIKNTQKQLCTIAEDLKHTQAKLIDSRKKSAVAALSAGILHQLSQPITAIFGFARFMKTEMPLKDPLYKAVTLLDEQSSYVKEMLENLMQLVRHHQIVKTPVDINATIKKSMHLLCDELRIKQVSLGMELAHDIPPLVADSLHLQQIFMNLTVNSIEAVSDLPQESPRTLLVISSYDRANHQVIITFKDNGPGIPMEHQQKIFDPFFTTKATGSGIGLSLCRDLVTEHNGTIRFDSDNHGTAFTMAFSCASI